MRFFNTVGPRQTGRYGMVLPRFIAAARRGEPLRVYGDGEQTRDFTFIENVTDANIKAAQTSQGLGGVANVANGERVSLNDLIDVMRKITDNAGVEPIYENERLGDVKHSQADNTRAREWFGYEKLVGLEEGIGRTIDWWKSSRFAK